MRGLIRHFSRLAVCLLLVMAAAANAEVFITPKHLVILHQGLDSVFGSYVFAVQNTGQAQAHFKSAVMLPKETVDFAPQEGVTASELTLDPGTGRVTLEKDFPSGVQIVSIGFKVPASYGRGVLTLTPVTDIQSFSLLIPRSTGMTAQSAILSEVEAQNAPDPQYQALQSTAPLQSETPLTIEVAGLPEGRSRIWIVGFVVAGLLALLAGFLAVRTRPKITGDGGDTVLVG